MKKQTTLLLFFLLQVLIASAQSIQTDAPSASFSASTLRPGTFQIESRLQLTQTFSNGWKTYQWMLPSNLFRLSLSKNAEFRIVSGMELQHSQNTRSFGFSPLQLGTKIQLLRKENTQLALLIHGEVPNLDLEHYTGSGIVAFNHALNNKNSMGFNAGFHYASRNTIESHELTASLYLSHQFSPKLSMFGEVYGGYQHVTTLHTESTWFNTDFGLLYLVTDHFQIDFTFGAGILDRMYFHALGFNYQFRTEKKQNQ